MIPGAQKKFLLEMAKDGNLLINEEQKNLLLGETEFNWKLVRERDGLTNESKGILWLEWDENGRFKSKHDEPKIGRSLIMSPFNDFYTWQTTDVTEIVEQREDYIKFKTKNSVYELYKL